MTWTACCLRVHWSKIPRYDCHWLVCQLDDWQPSHTACKFPWFLSLNPLHFHTSFLYPASLPQSSSSSYISSPLLLSLSPFSLQAVYRENCNFIMPATLPSPRFHAASTFQSGSLLPHLTLSPPVILSVLLR